MFSSLCPFSLACVGEMEEKILASAMAAFMLTEGMAQQGLVEDLDDWDSDDEDTQIAKAYNRTESEIPESSLDYWRLYLNHMSELLADGFIHCDPDEEPCYHEQRLRMVQLLLYQGKLGPDLLWAYWGMRDHWRDLLEKMMIEERKMPSG